MRRLLPYLIVALTVYWLYASFIAPLLDGWGLALRSLFAWMQP